MGRWAGLRRCCCRGRAGCAVLADAVLGGVPNVVRAGPTCPNRRKRADIACGSAHRERRTAVSNRRLRTSFARMFAPAWELLAAPRGLPVGKQDRYLILSWETRRRRRSSSSSLFLGDKALRQTVCLSVRGRGDNHRQTTRSRCCHPTSRTNISPREYEERLASHTNKMEATPSRGRH